LALGVRRPSHSDDATATASRVMGAWVSYLLQQIGFSADRSGTVVVLGLDNAGKSTLLLRCATGALASVPPPTQRAREESFRLGGVIFRAWDLGGHEAVRHLWSSFCGGACDGIVFIIDASDEARFEEAGEELELLLADLLLLAEKAVGEGAEAAALPPPVAVLLNKCDLAAAKEEREIIQAVGLDEICADQPRLRVRTFGCSVFENRGFQPAFRWLAEFLGPEV
jgi:GTPase SAR1 family protein